jgi:hypothetical protein
MESQFLITTQRGILSYDVVDGMMMLINSNVVLNTIYYIILLIALFKPTIHVFILILTCMITLLNVCKKGGSILLVIINITVILSIVNPFLHTPLIIVVSVMNVLSLLFMVGIVLSLVPQFTGIGRFILNKFHPI